MNRREFLKLSGISIIAIAFWPIVNMSKKTPFQDNFANLSQWDLFYRKPTQKGIDFLVNHVVTSGDSDPEKKLIAITYDDQPFNENVKPIETILEAFKQRNAKATFFFRMEGLDLHTSNVEIVKRIIGESHELGFHGWKWDHPNYLEYKNDEIRRHLEKCIEAINKIDMNYVPRFIRWPFGLTGRLVSIAAEYGLQIVNWNSESGGTDPETINRVVKPQKGYNPFGRIVLSHMHRFFDYTQAGKILDELIQLGYNPVNLSEILKPEDRIPETKDYFSNAPFQKEYKNPINIPGIKNNIHS